ncbi:MAG TPA: hypothetical protein VMT39_02915 [Candidatus Bathyarchaeia archaeon]|nr:hypothetical protein [Candidatus Bathyarchaeia archaeon]
MKRTVFLSAASLLFAGSIGLGTAFAAPTPITPPGTKQITGCLAVGPTAREYLLKTSDGATWGVTEKDMMMNDYVGKQVTITGDVEHPSASVRKEGNATHYVRARDIVVENDTCQK